MSLDEARKAAYSAVDHILPSEAAEYISADFLADAAIDAFLADLLKSHAVVPREASEEMLAAGYSRRLVTKSTGNAPLDDIARERLQTIYAAMIAAAESPAPQASEG